MSAPRLIIMLMRRRIRIRMTRRFRLFHDCFFFVALFDPFPLKDTLLVISTQNTGGGVGQTFSRACREFKILPLWTQLKHFEHSWNTFTRWNTVNLRDRGGSKGKSGGDYVVRWCVSYFLIIVFENIQNLEQSINAILKLKLNCVWILLKRNIFLQSYFPPPKTPLF